MRVFAPPRTASAGTLYWFENNITCGVGAFGNSTGRPPCRPCSPGYACPAGSTNATAVLCFPGKYSLAGSGSCTPCPAGTFGATAGLALASCTAPCVAGRYGAVGGLSSENCTGPCSAGYSCPPGSLTPTASTCPAGRFSLSGAAVCDLCAAGTYNGSVARTAPCTASCPPGSFCVAGSAAPVDCPAGRYGDTSGLQNNSCTDACPVGSYCPLGTATPALCPPGECSDAAFHQYSCCFVLQCCCCLWLRMLGLQVASVLPPPYHQVPAPVLAHLDTSVPVGR